MDANERQSLFRQMISANIRQYESGLTEFPLTEIRNYCDAIGLKPDDEFFLSFSLPGGWDGYYNFFVGDSTDNMALLELIEVYYWDGVDGKLEVINGGTTLYGALYRDFYSGKDLLCGLMLIDRYGRVYVKMRHGDNVMAIFRITPTVEDFGVQLFRADGEKVYRIWSDGDILFVAPTILMLLDCRPS